MYIHVYIYAYVYIYIRIYIYTNVCLNINTCIAFSIYIHSYLGHDRSWDHKEIMRLSQPSREKTLLKYNECVDVRTNRSKRGYTTSRDLIFKRRSLIHVFLIHVLLSFTYCSLIHVLLIHVLLSLIRLIHVLLIHVLLKLVTPHIQHILTLNIQLCESVHECLNALLTHIAPFFHLKPRRRCTLHWLRTHLQSTICLHESDFCNNRKRQGSTQSLFRLSTQGEQRLNDSVFHRHTNSLRHTQKTIHVSTKLCSIQTQSHSDIRKQHDTHVAAITHMPAVQKPHTPHEPGVKKVPHLSTDVMLRYDNTSLDHITHTHTQPDTHIQK